MTEKRSRISPIAIEPNEFRKLGYEMVDRVADLIGSMDNRKVVEFAEPDQIRELINSDSTLPEKGEEPAKILSEATALLTKYSLYNGHPKFWGYVTSSPAPIGMLGDLLAAAVNSNVGAFQLAPVATEIEAQTVRWIAELLGYPTDCGGILVSGGNMANFIGFVAARAAKAKHKIREQGAGHSNSKRMFVYVSKETHTWIQKAADLFGLGTDSIRWIDTNDEQQIDIEKLKLAVEKDINDGHIPMMVVGSAGTVSTGAVDPLPEIAEYCRANDIWFHVDGAYGAFAAVVPDADPSLRGLSLADSIAVDPHKWLYAPLEVGCALVRNKEHLRAAFSYHPPYYHFDIETINYFDFGMQNSRGFRALKVWLALKQVGHEGYAKMIAEDIDLTVKMYEALLGTNEIETSTRNLSIVTFRFVPGDLKDRTGQEKVDAYLDKLNEEILIGFKTGGEMFVSNAIIGGRFYLRACIVNFRTSLEDVNEMPALVVAKGREIDSHFRSTMDW